jgi:hypothetical protein
LSSREADPSNEHDPFWQLTEKLEVGAAFGAGGGGAGAGAGAGAGTGVTDPPDPFTRRSLFGDPEPSSESAPDVALPVIAAATCAGDAPGFSCR